MTQSLLTLRRVVYNFNIIVFRVGETDAFAGFWSLVKVTALTEKSSLQ